MKHNAHGRSGFTLLEVLVAVTILAIVMAAVFGTFATASSSMDRGLRRAEMVQQARFAFDVVEQDLLNVFYRDETSYNLYATQLLNQYEQLRQQAEATGSFDEFERIYGPGGRGGRNERGASEAGRIGNPFARAQIIDLGFRGNDSNGKGTLTFTRYIAPEPGARSFPLGLAKVDYTISEGKLVRSLDTVEEPPRTWDGEELEREQPPEKEIVAEGIESFELAFAFWYDNQWYETSEWDSSRRLIRNPRHVVTDEFSRRRRSERTSEASTGGTPLQPGDPGWNEYINARESEPLDRLPAYVRVRIAIRERDRKGPVGALREYQRIVRLTPSLETYFIDPQLDEEMRRVEQRERDARYTPIFPGAMMDVR